MTSSMRLGVCYYPEHWPEERWADDARRMAQMGLTRVRIGEFAWSRIEPAPGQTKPPLPDQTRRPHTTTKTTRRPHPRHAPADQNPAITKLRVLTSGCAPVAVVDIALVASLMVKMR